MIKELGTIIHRRAADESHRRVEQPARSEPPAEGQGVAAPDIEKCVVGKTPVRPQAQRKASTAECALGRIAEIREAPSAEKAQRIALPIDREGSAIEGGQLRAPHILP